MLDQIISLKVLPLQTIVLTPIMKFITSIGDVKTIAVFSLLVLIFLLHKKQYLKSKIFVLTMLSATFLTQILKYLIQRPRPIISLVENSGFSFPSGHTTRAMAFFGILIYLFSNKIKNKFLRILFIIANILLTLLIGFSRIYLNTHWMTDVLAGLILGLICIFGSILISKKYI